MFKEYHKTLETLHYNCLEPRAYYIPYHSEGAALSFDRYSSKKFILLNGEWNFRYYKTFEDVNEDFLHTPFEETIKVPCCWQVYTDREYDAPLYSNLKYPFPLDPPYVPAENPCGHYSRSIKIDKQPGKKYYMLFEGVSSCFYLFINNDFAAYSQVSHSTDEIDITDFIQNGVNRIDVLVVKWCDGSYLEDQDMFRLSGIFRDTYILERDSEHIEDVFIRTTVSDDLKKAVISAEISGRNDYSYKLISPDGTVISEGNDINVELENPELWSSEIPNLYTLLLMSGSEYIPFRVAVRKLEIKGNVAYFNNQPIKLYGINRHDSNPETGYYCDIEHMKRDLRILKQGNCNTIRTSHYPSSPLFVELCNEYGFMLCDEADIETHGMGFEYRDTWDWPRWSLLSRSDDWEESYVDRAKLLFERDKNFGNVIMWSLGNESGCGKNHRRMREYIKSRDENAIVHYENAHLEFKSVPDGENYSDISDVESRMYASLDYTESYAQNKEAKKPFFFCEFSCSMSTGDVHAHCDVFRKYPAIFGGCFWEFTDHAVDIGGGRYRYGGDFGDVPNDGICCVDGIVFPDRTLRPGFYDMKKGYEPFECELKGGNLTVFNRYYFRNLDNVTAFVTLEDDGKVISEKAIKLDIAPRSRKVFELGFTVPESSRLYLTVSVKLESDEFWAPKDYEIGFNQFDLSVPERENLVYTGGAPEIKEDKRYITVTAGDTVFSFDKPYGVIRNMIKNGVALLDGPILPELMKAPGYNEDGMIEDRKSAFIHRAALKAYNCRIEKNDNCIKIICDCSIGGPAVVPVLRGTMNYTFFGNGEADICFSGDYSEQLKKMGMRPPRFGFVITMPGQNEQMEYYGKGPGECYQERHKAQRYGRFVTTVNDNFVPYIRPIENGAHFDTKEAKAGDGVNGIKFEPLCTDSFIFNAAHYSPEDLMAVKHNDELVPGKKTYVYCDYKMELRGGRGYYENIEPERKWDLEPFEFGIKISAI